MIGKDPDTNDTHILLDKDVEILHSKNLIVFMNEDQKKEEGKIFIRINNEDDLNKLDEAIQKSRKYLKDPNNLKNKNDYISFSGQTHFALQKPQ